MPCPPHLPIYPSPHLPSHLSPSQGTLPSFEEFAGSQDHKLAEVQLTAEPCTGGLEALVATTWAQPRDSQHHLLREGSQEVRVHLHRHHEAAAGPGSHSSSGFMPKPSPKFRLQLLQLQGIPSCTQQPGPWLLRREADTVPSAPGWTGRSTGRRPWQESRGKAVPAGVGGVGEEAELLQLHHALGPK